jgi:glycosyltransferase involved in cell wall biosynthesis
LTLTVGVDASVITSSSGGTRVYAIQLLQALVELRPAWTFILYLRREGDESALGQVALASNVKTRIVASRPNVWRIQVALAARLERDRVDLYHSLGFFLPVRWPGPKVVTIHDLNVYVTARNWLRLPTLLPWLDLALQTAVSIRAADRVITDSESSRKQITRIMRLPSERVEVIPLAADSYFDKPAAAGELAEVQTLTSGRPFVLFVGILSPQKNLLTLLRAYADSRLADHGVNMVLAGSNVEGYASILRASADKLGIAGNLLQTGFVSKPTLRALYQSSLCLVLPSHGEGFGLPLVEAMASGTPILAANRQAIPEVLGDSGCLFEPDQDGALAALLRRVATDAGFLADLRLRSAGGRGRHSWQRTAAATAAVYEEVVASRRR